MPRNLTVHIAKNHQEADEWDIQQNLKMSPQERLRAARILQLQYFGKHSPDVKKSTPVSSMTMTSMYRKNGKT
ncbi:MAG: hypothetical protein JJU37_12635 [Balneolaceae bacterium]|nr:hypothetical protein [Balneolaceae bacterium]